MNLKESLTYARGLLTENNVDDAALEAEVLLRNVIGINRAQFFTYPDIELDAKQEKTFEEFLARRIKGEPSAYITGHREFYGLDFNVNRDVLIPRPETELLVEQAIRLADNHETYSIVDVGTGCGAIAITLALNLTHVKIYATDISSAALKIAIANCIKHGVLDRIIVLYGDMLSPVPEAVDLIVANLPYVTDYDLSDSGTLSYEPKTALKGGADGLNKLKQLFRQSGEKLKSGGHVLAEIGQGQATHICDFVRTEFAEAQLEIHKDLAGIKRVIQARLTKALS